jgi:hypothetical protein
LSDKIVNLEDYKKEKYKESSAIKAFTPDAYYICPDMGAMIHVLFLTDKSIHYDNEPIYVMEDQFGNFFSEPMEEETCIGWHETTKEAFMFAVERGFPPDAPA